MSKELQASVQRAIERLKAVLSPCLPKDWMSAELPSFSRDPKPVMVSLCCRSEDVVTFAVPFLEIGLEPSFKEFASVCGLVRRVRRKQAGELYQLLRWFARFAARHRTQIIEAARRGDDLGDASVIDPYTGDLEFGPETLLFEFAEAAGATPAQARQYALHGPTPPPKSSGCLLLFVTGLLWIVACVTG